MASSIGGGSRFAIISPGPSETELRNQICKTDAAYFESIYKCSITELSKAFNAFVSLALKKSAGFKGKVVKLDNQLSVEFPWGSEIVTRQCHCGQKTASVGHTTITNPRKSGFSFDDHVLHNIVEHQYFGTGIQRIDPIHLAETIGFKKPTVSIIFEDLS